MRLYEEIQNSQNAEVHLIIPCGSNNEEEGKTGISHLLEHLNLAFARHGVYKARVFGHTTYEYTKYTIVCKNNYENIIEAIQKMVSILNGYELNESNLEDIKNDVILEIDQQKTNPYFYLRNQMLRKGLPKEICDILPVGEKKTVKKISFDNILIYFKQNYSKCNSAICISSKYDFSEYIESKNTNAIIKEYPNYKDKNCIKWFFSELYSEKGKKIYSIYFMQNFDYNSTEQFVLNELEVNYFIIAFDKALKEKTKSNINAVVYQNRIIRNISIYTYEFEDYEGCNIYDISFNSTIQEVLDDIQEKLSVKKEDLDFLCNILYEKFQNINFFEKCYLHYLYGVDLRIVTKKMIEKLCEYIDEEKLKSIIEKLF